MRIDRLFSHSALWTAAVGFLAADISLAEGPLLHEYFTLTTTPAEALNNARAPTGDAANSAASVPPPRDRTAGEERATGATVSTSPEGTPVAQNQYRADPSPSLSSYELDANTTQPGKVAYSDPFSPSIPPFKRLFAYDAVSDSFELIVKDSTLTPVPPALLGADASADQFFASLSLVARGEAIRIPSVGPGAALVGGRLSPSTPYSVLRDSADNWFLNTQGTGALTFEAHVQISRDVFGSPFFPVDWDHLRPLVNAPPAAVAAVGNEVLQELEVSQALQPAEAVTRLVAHFRGFEPSEAGLPKLLGGELYRRIALTQLGVCRHRAFAFVVSALTLGLPARFVRNEAHAWVEVFDTKRWHRIDLGGAAGEMHLATESQVRYQPPGDPYSWPASSRSGLDMAHAASTGAGGGARAGEAIDEPEPPGNVPAAPSAESATSESGGAAGADESDGGAAPISLNLVVGSQRVRRGGRVRLSGSAFSQGSPCRLARIDIFVADSSANNTPVGTLATDNEGNFAGVVSIPLSIASGDYELSVSTPGSQYCGAGQAH